MFIFFDHIFVTFNNHVVNAAFIQRLCGSPAHAAASKYYNRRRKNMRSSYNFVILFIKLFFRAGEDEYCRIVDSTLRQWDLKIPPLPHTYYCDPYHISLKFVSLKVLPSKGVRITGASAISSSSNLPIIFAFIFEPTARQARAFPSIFAN